MNQHQASLLADRLVHRLKATDVGHCARVDFLEQSVAVAVCGRIAAHADGDQIHARILGGAEGATDLADGAEFWITTDQAIALRNRKQVRVCLFVPADLVDAAASSLANSFEVLDGRALYAEVLEASVAKLPAAARSIWTVVARVLKRMRHVGVDERLDYAACLHDLDEQGALDRAGLELWRVGLIADARVDFTTYLEINRKCTLALARPATINAALVARLAALNVDAATATALTGFFRARSLYDVRTWSRALAEEAGLTFDQWVFPEAEATDLRKVSIRPFLGPDGAVARACKLEQPDGPGGALKAACGPKGKLVVKWTTEPLQPANLQAWRVEIVPAYGDPLEGVDLDLPQRDVPGSRRDATLSLDFDLEEPPDMAFVVRVSALDGAGNVLTVPEDDGQSRSITDLSSEFFLGAAVEQPTPTTRRISPSIAFGRLEYVVERNNSQPQESQPQWVGGNREYFSLRLNEQRTLNIATADLLVEVQQRALEQPRSGGCFELNLGELRPAAAAEVVTRALPSAEKDAWSAFLRAREMYFVRLRKNPLRNVVEAAEWTPELAGAALRYAQAYSELLAALAAGAPPSELVEALAVDTVLVRVVADDDRVESALIVLPTHPLRSAWIAGYTQLLAFWEQELVKRPGREPRKGLVDLSAVRQLAPSNVPLFVWHLACAAPFLYFDNLCFYYGVALEPEVLDPHRRLSDVAAIVGANQGTLPAHELYSNRLEEYLRRFHAAHPYVRTLVVAAVNGARAGLLATSLRRLLAPAAEIELSEPENGSTEDIPAVQGPAALELQFYIEDERTLSAPEMARLSALGADLGSSTRASFLAPALSVAARPLAALQHAQVQGVHLTLMADMTRPQIVTAPRERRNAPNSQSLYGLVARLLPTLSATEGVLKWRYGILDEKKPDPHPAGPRYSEVLGDLHTAMQRAVAAALSGGAAHEVALEVSLTPDDLALVEHVHAQSDWVVTLDRFFSLDVYDAPSEPAMTGTASKYLLDYAPEFSDGLGHRMMLTTATRREVDLLLHNAMNELGFHMIADSVRHLLRYLKTISGRLVIDALDSPAMAAGAIGLGAVTAWLQARGRLEQAVLVPVDAHLSLFGGRVGRSGTLDARRCDLILFGLRRNIVDATLIEVKWRRGAAALAGLEREIAEQTQATAQVLTERFGTEERVDGVLQRGLLAHLLRFYWQRARRYGIFSAAAETAFAENLARLERTKFELRTTCEGYVVALDGEPHEPLARGDTKITVLTPRDFESAVAQT